VRRGRALKKARQTAPRSKAAARIEQGRDCPQDAQSPARIKATWRFFGLRCIHRTRDKHLHKTARETCGERGYQTGAGIKDSNQRSEEIKEAAGRFIAPPPRPRHVELQQLLSGHLRSREREAHPLASRGVVCGAVLDTAEVLANPHLRERGAVYDIDHPTRGRFSVIGCPVRLLRLAVRADSSAAHGRAY
jgi:hypothetical protein